MSYRVEVLRQASKDLEALPTGARQRVRAGVDSLATDPRAGNTRALQANLKGLRRLRVGDYRVTYEVHDLARLVTVIEVGHRRDVYRRTARRG